MPPSLGSWRWPLPTARTVNLRCQARCQDRAEEVRRSLCTPVCVWTHRTVMEVIDEEAFAVAPLAYSDDSDDCEQSPSAWCDDSAGSESDEECGRENIPSGCTPAYTISERSQRDPEYMLQRWDCRFLSVKAFRELAASTQTPIILSGLGHHVAPRGLDPDRLQTLLPPDLAVPVREQDGRWNASRFFERLRAGDPIYCADAPLARLCPWVLRDVRVPRYFLHCFTHRTRQPLPLIYETPALFVGGPGTRSSLHVDQMVSNFWMALTHGKKRWITFHPHACGER